MDSDSLICLMYLIKVPHNSNSMIKPCECHTRRGTNTHKDCKWFLVSCLRDVNDHIQVAWFWCPSFAYGCKQTWTPKPQSL
jgi:hypothetical protein